MPVKRPRRYGPVLLVAVALLAVAACGEQQYPNSTFNPTSDLNIAIKALWDRLFFFGTFVFVFVEALLIFTIIKFRKREGSPEPKQVHGNAALEITWTAIPALILVLIAVPTVKTIFKTQAKAPAGALEVEVIGHQWWWEFRYPAQNIVTANELYIPAGRPVNFKLTARDVLHSFWTPQLGGKRDLITNRTNWLWYTPDSSLSEHAFNGACAEYCGSSHANMRFRLYTVSPDKFASWAAHQSTVAAMAPAPTVAPAAPGVTPAVPAAVLTPAAASEGYVFPLDRMTKSFPHTVPRTPLPNLAFDDAILAGGDAARGRALFVNLAKAPCLTCHVIRGEMALLKDDQAKGPNLTHFASRHTFGGGLFATAPKALALWIKNAPLMKPGSIMPTLGTGQYNSAMKMTVTAGGLDDRQIADLVAYLMALK